MNKSKIVAAAILTAAATIGPISTPAEAAPSPTITVPCTKTVADNNISGRNGIKVADTQGTIHYIYKGYPQRFCPWQVYVYSGWDVYATSHGAYSNYYATGWHTFKSSLLDVNYPLYLWEH